MADTKTTDFSLEVKFLETELREKDEIDKKAFTMYSLHVTKRVGEEVDSEWDLFRRYSQFHQLMTVLGTSFPPSKALSDKKFPPKQSMGNLVASFVNERKNALQIWTSELLALPNITSSSDALAFFEARVGLMQKGSASPDITVTDLPGRDFDSKAFADHIIIYSAASRYNFSKLTQALTPPMNALVKKYPSLKYTTVSIADMREVPDKMLSMVNPILNKVDQQNRVNAQAGYSASAGSEGCFDRSRMFFVPDYKGNTLTKLGFEDANWTFRISMVFNGVVQCALQSSSKNFAQQMSGTIDDLVKDNPDLIAKDLEGAGAGTDIKEESINIPARGSTDKKITVDAETWLAWDFSLEKAEHVEFGLFYIDGDGKEQVKMPMIVVKAKKAIPYRGAWKVQGQPGQYILRWGNSMSYWSSKALRRKVFVL